MIHLKEANLEPLPKEQRIGFTASKKKLKRRYLAGIIMKKNNMIGEDDKIIPLAQEEVAVSKVTTKGTSYQLSKRVDVETKTEKLSLLSENLQFKEIEKNEYIDAYPETRTEGNILIVPVVKEIEIVTKQLVLVKELHIEKTVSSKLHDIKYDIKSEHLEVRRTDKK